VGWRAQRAIGRGSGPAARSAPFTGPGPRCSGEDR